MDDNRAPTPRVTPAAYRCPGCGRTAPMVVKHPWWHCAFCPMRLIPADLHPRLAIESLSASNGQHQHARTVRSQANGQQQPIPQSLTAEAG